LARELLGVVIEALVPESAVKLSMKASAQADRVDEVQLDSRAASSGKPSFGSHHQPCSVAF
jgi:hypothetical protein